MEGTRRQGRTKSIRIDEVKNHLHHMCIRNWRNSVEDRVEWRRIVLEAKVHYGL